MTDTPPLDDVHTSPAFDNVDDFPDFDDVDSATVDLPDDSYTPPDPAAGTGEAE